MSIAIVGSSIAGLSVAFVLERLGYEIALYEREVGLTGRGAGLGFDLDLIPRFVGQPVEALPLVKYSGRDQTTVDFRGNVRRRVVPGVSVSTSWDAVHSILSEATSAAPNYGTRVVAIEQSDRRPHIHLASGQVVQHDAVVLADGYASALRSQVTTGSAEYAGYVVFRGVISESWMKSELAPMAFTQLQRQVSTPTSAAVMYGIPDEVGAFDEGQRRLNWALYQAVSEQEMIRLFATSSGGQRRTVPLYGFDASVTNAIVEPLKQWGEPWAGVAEVTSRENALMASAIFEFTPSRLASGAVALVGDAAHSASPITGAGAGAAIRDAIALGDAMAATTSIEEAFATYNDTRLPIVSDLVAAGQAWGADFLDPSLMQSHGPVVRESLDVAY